ncbi:hypothetical protein C2845_PM07G25740 [Panicum miliaceum]|uniref:Uncharacterized protein n=1 Tax=Panicum miliaceum TaxID=4540 RepID=A0A3L6SNB4_PANMI|nr:hypothetical protein C2845_PM07G25740 [Panicum miliaceum]
MSSEPSAAENLPTTPIPPTSHIPAKPRAPRSDAAEEYLLLPGALCHRGAQSGAGHRPRNAAGISAPPPMKDAPLALLRTRSSCAPIYSKDATVLVDFVLSFAARDIDGVDGKRIRWRSAENVSVPAGEFDVAVRLLISVRRQFAYALWYRRVAPGRRAAEPRAPMLF